MQLHNRIRTQFGLLHAGSIELTTQSGPVNTVVFSPSASLRPGLCIYIFYEGMGNEPWKTLKYTSVKAAQPLLSAQHGAELQPAPKGVLKLHNRDLNALSLLLWQLLGHRAGPTVML